MNMKFTWDIQKAITNVRKHQVSFEIAMHVFNDPFALTYQDRIENSEYRWQTIGSVDGCVILLVAHTIEEKDQMEIIRIISARRANSKEKKRYEQSIR